MEEFVVVWEHRLDAKNQREKRIFSNDRLPFQVQRHTFSISVYYYKFACSLRTIEWYQNKVQQFNVFGLEGARWVTIFESN